MNHSLVPQAKLEYINAFISKIKIDLSSLPVFFTAFLKQQRPSLKLENLAENDIVRESLEVMLTNLEEPAQNIILKNTPLNLNTFSAFRSYLESKSVFVLDFSLTGINDECLEVIASGTGKNMSCCLKALYLTNNKIGV